MRLKKQAIKELELDQPVRKSNWMIENISQRTKFITLFPDKEG